MLGLAWPKRLLKGIEAKAARLCDRRRASAAPLLFHLRMIVETADLVFLDDQPVLIVPVMDDLIDTLAAFEAEGEDRENDLCDEPQLDDEPTAG